MPAVTAAATPTTTCAANTHHTDSEGFCAINRWACSGDKGLISDSSADAFPGVSVIVHTIGYAKFTTGSLSKATHYT
jgi:hypothetical protein